MVRFGLAAPQPKMNDFGTRKDETVFTPASLSRYQYLLRVLNDWFTLWSLDLKTRVFRSSILRGIQSLFLRL